MSRLDSVLASTLLAATVCAAAADDSLLELRGKIVDGSRRVRPFRVSLFSIESEYSDSTVSDLAGEFHFRKLDPGNYTISILRRGLGEIHRTVVVTSSRADKKGVVRITLPFSTDEAAASGTGALVSRSQLAIPWRARAKYEEAARCMSKHDAEGAKRFFEEALRVAPGYSAAWNALGVLAYKEGHYDDAERYFRKAAEAEPGAFDPEVNLGGVLLNVNRPEEALPFNQKAVQAHPKDALPNTQLGMNYFVLGRFDQAEEYLKAAAAIDPAHFSQPQWFLATIYIRRGDRSAAIHELRDLLELHPDGMGAERARRALARLERPPEQVPATQAEQKTPGGPADPR